MKRKRQDPSATPDASRADPRNHWVVFQSLQRFGYGFLETPYVNALTLELQNRGLRVQRELPIELHHEGQKVGLYRADMVVEQKVLVETKASAAIGDADLRQIFNYLRASKLTVGLLLHFGPTPGHKRVVWTGKHLETEIDPAVSQSSASSAWKELSFPAKKPH